MTSYITRLCWNDHQWTRPSGSASRLETASFATISGFGFEEWLFCDSIRSDGWRFGFLQGVNKAQERIAGSSISVYLFAIGPESKRFLVGKIRQCQILLPNEADAAHKRLATNGVISKMVEDVRAVGGDPGFIENQQHRENWTLDVINIRFRPEDAIRYASPVEATIEIGLANRWRYQLYQASEPQIAAWESLAPSIGLHESLPLFPEELPNGRTYREGGVETVLVNRYERDRSARDRCIGHFGAVCSACGIDFGERFGEEFSGLMHVHHLKPISEVGQSYRVDPILDLRPVCPNCHAMIHYHNRCRSIEELRTLFG